MNNMKKITCRGQLKKGFELNWFEGFKRLLENEYDFVFILIDNGDFPEQFKYIQDNNDLNFLKIEKIENERDIF